MNCPTPPTSRHACSAAAEIRARQPFAALARAALAALFPACILMPVDDVMRSAPGEADTAIAPSQPPAPSGQADLIVDWTIEQTKSPVMCASHGVERIAVRLETRTRALGVWAIDCTAFEAEFAVPPGNYTGAAWLLDSREQARTTQAEFGSIRVASGATEVIELNFGATSFY